MSPNAIPIRVVIQQPALPRYRVPVFRRLAQRPGIDLHVVYGSAPDAPVVAEPEGFRGSSWPIRSFLGGRLLWHTAGWAYASRRRADVLVLSWNVRFVSLVPTLLRAKFNGVKTILWGHGYSKRETGWRLRFRDTVTALADGVLFYNSGAAQRFIERTGGDPRRAHVAPNSLDQAPIREARDSWLGRPEDLANFRAANHLNAGPVILFVSRLLPENRLDLLLEAVTRLRTEFPTVQVVLIGQGDAAEPLRRLADTLGIGDRVRFVGPLYGEMELAPWFLTADVFCYPANAGLSILHAFGYGLPVVTSDRSRSHGPEIEALRPGENGFTYRDDDPQALGAVLRQLFLHPATREHLSRGAMATVNECFTLERMVDGMAGAICHALGSHPPQGRSGGRRSWLGRS